MTSPRSVATTFVIGVAVGILVADVLVFLIGTGTWQIGVVTALAMGAALLLGGGPLLVSQAATSAVLVSTIQVPEDGISLARFLDALFGGTIALAVAPVSGTGGRLASGPATRSSEAELSAVRKLNPFVTCD